MTDKTTQTTINSELTRLRAEYPILRDHAPLAIGIREHLKPLINLSSQKTHKAIYFICHHTKYLKAIAAGGSRHNLDGTINGEVTRGQAEHAQAKLEQAVKPNQIKKQPESVSKPRKGKTDITSKD